MEVIPTLRQYNRAEERFRLSLELRDVIPDHSYPGRQRDLDLIQAFHRGYGIPPQGAFRRFVWRLRGGG